MSVKYLGGAAALGAAAILASCAGDFVFDRDQHSAAGAGDGPVAIPEPLVQEHEQLHAQLQEATRAGGRTGEAARRVQEALSDHFEEENRIAMPPLGLLKPLSQGEVTEDMRPAIEMARKTEQSLERFLEEHQRIHKAVDALERAAEEEGKTAQAEFARRLRLHAQTEEQVLYPATILVGERLEREFARQGISDRPDAAP